MISGFYLHTIKSRIHLRVSSCCYICQTSHQRALNQFNGQLWIVLFCFTANVYPCFLTWYKYCVKAFLLKKGHQQVSITFVLFNRTQTFFNQTSVQTSTVFLFIHSKSTKNCHLKCSYHSKRRCPHLTVPLEKDCLRFLIKFGFVYKGMVIHWNSK